MATGQRWLLKKVDLWPQERELCAKAAWGGLLDLRSGRPDEDDPAQGRAWRKDRQIRAPVLFQLLTGYGPVLADTVMAVRLRGAHVVGRLNMGGLTLRCPLELYDCHLHWLGLAKAEAPNISLRGSHLRSRLSARRLRVTHTFNLTGFHCNGAVVVREAHIGGQLDCTRAVFTNPNGWALNASVLTVDASMYLRKARCSGEVRLAGAHARQLVCTEAVFSNEHGPALTADALTVDTGMFLTKAQCSGEVQLVGAHTGQLDCTEAVFTNPNGLAVNLERASVGQAVRMMPAKFHGGLDLSHARVGAWHDDKHTWPKQIQLKGFVYEAINSNATVRDRLRRWLPSKNYLPQPYEQLAGVYRREGNEQAARIVAIGNQRARRAVVSGWRGWPSRGWSAVLRWTIGYGYRHALALIPLTVLFFAGWLIFDAAYPGQLRPAKTGPEQPGFHAARYTLDLLLPVANFKQRDAFVAFGWAAWVSFLFIFAGWLLAVVVVAGLSGVFKRD